MAVYYFVMWNGPAIFGWTPTHKDWNSAFAFADKVHPSESFWLVPGTWEDND